MGRYNMATKESTLKNMLVTLFLVTFIASSVLAFMHKLTEEPIRLSKMRKKEQALKAVMPDFTNSPVEEMKTVKPEGSKYKLEVYPAKAEGEMKGFAVRSYTSKGYSGEFWIMVGFTPEGKINGITVLQQKETPGLGTKMTEKPFKSQFEGLDPSNADIRVSKDGGQIDAITAATISSRAYCGATRRAYKAFKAYKKQSEE